MEAASRPPGDPSTTRSERTLSSFARAYSRVAKRCSLVTHGVSGDDDTVCTVYNTRRYRVVGTKLSTGTRMSTNIGDDRSVSRMNAGSAIYKYLLRDFPTRCNIH